MKPVVPNFTSGGISHCAHFRNVTSSCLAYHNLTQIERWGLQIKISLEHFGMFNIVGGYCYKCMDIKCIQHDMGVNIKGPGHIYRQILHKNNKTNN